MIRLLGDPVRAQIVTLLAAGPACTCHLVADTGADELMIVIQTPDQKARLRSLELIWDAWS